MTSCSRDKGRQASLDSSLLSATIVIPQFNQPELTIAAIQSIRVAEYQDWPILVVDNGSSTESLRRLQQLDDPHTEVLSRPRQGLTAAWSVAAGRCQTDQIIFLNNDTLTTGPWVEALIAPLLSESVCMTGVEKRVESQLTPPCEVLSGWCFAIRTETFLQVGGFDETLTLYFSDTDLQLRVRALHAPGDGECWQVVTGLPLMHLSHRTAHRLEDQRAIWVADRVRFLRRWSGR